MVPLGDALLPESLRWEGEKACLALTSAEHQWKLLRGELGKCSNSISGASEAGASLRRELGNEHALAVYSVLARLGMGTCYRLQSPRDPMT